MRKAVITSLALVILLVWGFLKIGNFESQKLTDKGASSNDILPLATSEINYLPKGNEAKITHHSYYSLAYNNKMEVPEWVAYKLTENSLRVKNVPRASNYSQDHKVNGRSARHSDYSNSGYTRGHMVPAGDMAFNTHAMKESFFMSNMCPQLKEFNGGIWRELEENVRDWAYDNEVLYVASGPIFNDPNPQRIGKNRVAVPDAFYKVILDYEGVKKKGIAFKIPHQKSDRHLREYAVSINAIEQELGINFFDDLIENNKREEKLESSFDFQRWPVDKTRFQQRVNHWNKQ